MGPEDSDSKRTTVPTSSHSNPVSSEGSTDVVSLGTQTPVVTGVRVGTDGPDPEDLFLKLLRGRVDEDGDGTTGKP